MSDEQAVVGSEKVGFHVINHRHDDGRKCIEGLDGLWRHWDFEGRALSPREATPDVICQREHPSKEERVWHPDDRGDFGMPTLGMDVSPGAVFEIPTPVEDPVVDRKIVMVVRSEGIGMSWAGHEEGLQVSAVTEDAEYILANVIPGLLRRFLENNAKYARAQDIDLGVKGIVPDVNRKASVIIDRLWHGGGVIGEDTEEVIDDLIGHLLLMRAKLRTR